MNRCRRFTHAFFNTYFSEWNNHFFWEKNYLSQKFISSCISWAFFNKSIITSSSSSYFFLNMQVSRKKLQGVPETLYIGVRMITKYYDCQGPILVYLHKFPGGGLQIPILTWPLPQLDPRTNPTPTLVHVCLFFFFTSGSTFAHCFRCRERKQRSTDDDTMAEGDGDDVWTGYFIS